MTAFRMYFCIFGMLLLASPIFPAVVQKNNTTDVETNTENPEVADKDNTTDKSGINLDKPAIVEEKNTTDVKTNSEKPAVIEKKNTTDGVKIFENPAFEEEGEPYIEDDPFIENNPFDVLGRNSENPVVEEKNTTDVETNSENPAVVENDDDDDDDDVDDDAPPVGRRRNLEHPVVENDDDDDDDDVDDDAPPVARRRNLEHPGTNETQSKVKHVELQAFLRLMEDMDANKTGNAIKIQNFLFGDEEAIEGRSLLKMQSRGVESKAGVDFQKYWNNMRQVTDFIHIMKEYSAIICPIFKEIDIESLRNVFLQILDLALKPKEDLSE